jgi:hypothetical protein
MSTGTLGKNIQNKAGAVNNPDIQLLLKVNFLTRRQFMINQQHIDALSPHIELQLFELAAADEEPGGCCVPTGMKLTHNIDSRRQREREKLLLIIGSANLA